MSEAAYVNEAADWSNRMVIRESRGPGDLDNAMGRLQARYGIPYSIFWSLRYRRPKSITAAIYQTVKNAYDAERERQMRKLSHEIQVTKIVAGPDHPAVASAAAVVGEDVEGD